MFNSPNRLVGILFGVIYIVVGVLGFTVTRAVTFTTTQGELLIGVFGVNPLLNVTHLVLGAALIVGGMVSVKAAKMTNGVVGAVFLVLGVGGFFIAGTTLNLLALNMPDHFLHLASAGVLIVVALAADRDETSGAPATARQQQGTRTSDTD